MVKTVKMIRTIRKNKSKDEGKITSKLKNHDKNDKDGAHNKHL